MHQDQDNRRDRKRLRTLTHLATIAERLFADQGFDAVTMEQIAAAADVAKGTLYNHFPTKEAVLAYAIQHELGKGLAALAERLPPNAGFASGVGPLMDALTRWCEKHREYLAPYLRFRFMDIQAQPPRTGTNGPNDMVEVYALLIRNSQNSGEMRKDMDAAHLAVLFHHICLGALLRWLLMSNLKLRRELTACVDVFLNGATPRIAAAKTRRGHS